MNDLDILIARAQAARYAWRDLRDAAELLYRAEAVDLAVEAAKRATKAKAEWRAADAALPEHYRLPA